MKKDLKKYIFPGVCVLVVIVTFVMLFDLQKKADEITESKSNSVTNENVVNTNTVEQEDTNTNVVDDTTNTVDDEDNTSVQNTTANETAVSQVTSDENDKYTESKQNQAVELVKQKWGADGKVTFSNESVTSTGEYIVAVRNKSTTEVVQYFKVNIETGKVEVYY